MLKFAEFKFYGGFFVAGGLFARARGGRCCGHGVVDSIQRELYNQIVRERECVCV